MKALKVTALSSCSVRSSRSKKTLVFTHKRTRVSEPCFYISCTVADMNAVNVVAAKAEDDVEDQGEFIKYGAVDEFYQIGKEIGRGSYGTVKNCIHKKTQHVYAVKMIKTSTQTVRKNVLREIEVMRALGSHRKLVTLYDAYETPFEISMILEFVPGGELFERIIAEEYLMEDDAVDYVRQILEALQFMHTRKIVHLDLKPENILCVSMNSHDIKLVDFGLARDLSSVEDVKSSFGTPDFVAPEVIRMKPVSYASDLWSLGVVTYVLLSGLMPFSGDDDTQTLVKVAKADWDFDDDCFDELSEDAKDFIEGLLVKDPRERLTIEECLDHSWIKDAKDTVAKIHTQKHKAFMAKRRWKKTVHALLAVRRMSLSPLFSQNRRSSMDPSILTSSSELDEEQQSPDRKRFSPASGLGVDLPGRGHVATRSCFDLDMETIMALQKKADKAIGKNEPTDGRENEDGAESDLSDSVCSDELDDDKETKDGSLPRQRARTVSGASSQKERKTSEVSIAIGDASKREFKPVTFTFDSNELQENDKRILAATTAINTQTTRTNATKQDSAPGLRDAIRFTIDTANSTRQVQQPANFILTPQKLTLQLDPSSTSDGSEKIPTICVNDELCHVNSPSGTLNNNLEKMDRREAKMSPTMNVATVSLVPDGVQSITVKLDDINNPLEFPANQVSCHLSRPPKGPPSNLIDSSCLRLHRP